MSAIRYSIVGSDQNRVALGEAGLLRALKDIITPGQHEGTTRFHSNPPNPRHPNSKPERA